MSNTKSEKNPPVAKVRAGYVNGSIWANTTDKGTHYSVTFERRYRDSEGNWKSTHSYGPGDLLELEKAAHLAYMQIITLQQEAA